MISLLPINIRITGSIYIPEETIADTLGLAYALFY